MTTAVAVSGSATDAPGVACAALGNGGAGTAAPVADAPPPAVGCCGLRPRRTAITTSSTTSKVRSTANPASAMEGRFGGSAATTLLFAAASSGTGAGTGTVTALSWSLRGPLAGIGRGGLERVLERSNLRDDPGALVEELARERLHARADLGVRGRRPAERFELRRHRDRVRIARARIGCRRSADDLVERGERGVGRARQLDLVVDDLRDRRALVLAREHTQARERFEEHDPRRVDVRGAGERLRRELLGRHVEHLALDVPIASGVDAPRGLRNAEVEHARDAVRADEHVLRGHVAMDEAEQDALLVDRLVGSMQTVKRARHDRDHHARR